MESQTILFKVVTADIFNVRFGGRSFSKNYTKRKSRQTLIFTNYAAFSVMLIELDIESLFVCFLKIKHMQDCLV